MAGLKNEANDIGLEIAEKCAGLCKFVGMTILGTEGYYRNLSTPKVMLGYNSLFDELANKNDIVKLGIPFDSRLTTILCATSKFDQNGYEDGGMINIKYVNECLNVLLNSIPKDIYTKMYSLFITINQVLVAHTDNKTYAALNRHKMTMSKWMQAKDIFAKKSFEIYYPNEGRTYACICLNYYGFKIPIISIPINKNYFYTIDGGYFHLGYLTCPHPSWYISKILNGRESPDDANLRSQIITDDLPTWQNEPYYLVFGRNSSNQLNNDPAILQFYLDNSNCSPAEGNCITCYTDEGYIDVNNYLLMKYVFQQTVNITINSHNLSVEHITNTISKRMAFNDFRPPDNKQYNYAFSTIRSTNPSSYGQIAIEAYDVGKILKFSTFVSTSYNPKNENFTTPFSPLVIFRFYMSLESQKNFLFIENYSQYPEEYEILIKNDTSFRIVNKMYKTISNDEWIAQKLIIELVALGDLSAMEYYNSINQGPAQPAQPAMGGGLEQLTVLYDIGKYDTETYRVNPDGTKKIPGFAELLPYYLTNSDGENSIKMEKNINGFDYLDNSIFYMIPPEIVDLLMAQHTYNTTACQTKSLVGMNEHYAAVPLVAMAASGGYESSDFIYMIVIFCIVLVILLLYYSMKYPADDLKFEYNNIYNCDVEAGVGPVFYDEL
jgi:hypothetical protein